MNIELCSSGIIKSYLCRAGTTEPNTGTTWHACSSGTAYFRIYMIHVVLEFSIVPELCIAETTWQLDPELP